MHLLHPLVRRLWLYIKYVNLGSSKVIIIGTVLLLFLKLAYINTYIFYENFLRLILIKHALLCMSRFHSKNLLLYLLT